MPCCTAPGTGGLRLWTGDQFLYCQVTDGGHVVPSDRRAPQTAPRGPPSTAMGSGWSARSPAASSIGRGPVGTTVTARFLLSPR